MEARPPVSRRAHLQGAAHDHQVEDHHGNGNPVHPLIAEDTQGAVVHVVRTVQDVHLTRCVRHLFLVGGGGEWGNSGKGIGENRGNYVIRGGHWGNDRGTNGIGETIQ